MYFVLHMLKSVFDRELMGFTRLEILAPLLGHTVKWPNPLTDTSEKFLSKATLQRRSGLSCLPVMPHSVSLSLAVFLSLSGPRYLFINIHAHI